MVDSRSERRSVLSLFVLCGGLLLPLLSSPAQPDSPDRNLGRLQSKIGKIDKVFSAYNHSTPGCALGIYEKGKVAYAQGYGMADLNLNVPITPQTMFDIGSTSKQFTAAAILLLEQQGRIKLSDDVRKYLPELPDYGATITIDHLLHHTSGLRDYDSLLQMAGHYTDDYTDDQDALDVIVAQKALNFSPGSQWSYSNTGYFLLALIVKRVSGTSLAKFAKQELLTPLGMEKTHFRTDHTAVLRDRATAYTPDGKGGYSINMSNWDQIGDGGINTNVLELAKWDRNFSAPRVGGRALMDGLQARASLDDGTELLYARGLFVDTYKGQRRVYHNGSWAGYRAMFMRFPAWNVTIGLACNVDNSSTTQLAESVADLILPDSSASSDLGPGADTSVGDVPAVWTPGVYVDMQNQALVRLDIVDGKPVLILNGNPLPLDRQRDGRFATRGAPVVVEFDPKHEFFTISVVGAPSGKYRWIPNASAGNTDVSKLAGRYCSPELKSSWTVSTTKGSLVVNGRALDEFDLHPVLGDTYGTDSALFAFRRNAQGEIDGFEFTQSRTRRIWFDRCPKEPCRGER